MNPSIYLDPSGDLALELPAPEPFQGSHTIRIPATADGMKALVRLLRAREADTDRRIARDSAPTQAQVEAWLRANRAAKDREMLKILPNLEELGL